MEATFWKNQIEVIFQSNFAYLVQTANTAQETFQVRHTVSLREYELLTEGHA